MVTDDGATVDAAEKPVPHEPIERIILRSMNEGVMTLECNGRIFSVNPAAESILGVGSTDLVGRSMEEAFSSNPLNREFLEVFFTVVSLGSQTMRREVRFYRGDGQILDLTVAASFLELAECFPFAENVVAVFRDITPFKALEKVRRKAADHLSHEMKTPLAIIEASLEVFARGEPDAQGRQRALERMRRNLQRLSDIQQIIEEMLNPAEFHPRRIDLSAWVKDLLGDISRECPHRKAEWDTNLQPELYAQVNPDLVKTVIRSLMKNAVENTPDESHIMVAVGEEGGRPFIEVADRGVGIPMVERQFIFEGFHHTQDTDDYSSKRPYDFNAGGKGLELLRLTVLSEAGHFDLTFESARCVHIPTSRDHCPGAVSSCPHVEDVAGCLLSGGTTFKVVFPRREG
jgi:PAS domain S-box-containing protein